MTTVRDISWPRIFAEGAAIVVSILLAFWIEAWWSDRQERQEERVVLAALLQEFHDKKDRLEFRRRFNEVVLESTNRLIRAAVEKDYSLDPEEIDNLLLDLWWYNLEHEWETAVLDSIVSSGTLSIISSAELRLNLIQWPVTFDVIQLRVKRDETYFLDVLMPFWTKNAYLPQIYQANDSDELSGGEGSYTTPGPWKLSETADHSELLSNREFQNILVEKVDRQSVILGLAFGGLDERLDETIQMIEKELSK